MREERFTLVGIRPVPPPTAQGRPPRAGRPVVSAVIFLAVVLGCVLCPVLATKDPAYLDLLHSNFPPGGDFLFGTDTLGRDIFSMVWYGGRVSLVIGFGATALSTALAIVLGAVSGAAPPWLDGALMRLTELFMSVPTLLTTVLLQGALGKPTPGSLALVIGLTGWPAIAKVVRSEVRQIRSSEYVIASKCMGGSFFHILRRHYSPNFISSILFMVVMDVRGAIMAESTLSFMGLGLPLEVISWGSMLSLAQRAMLTGSWWMLLIPGAFLVVTLMCVTNLGNHLRRRGDPRHSNL